MGGYHKFKNYDEHFDSEKQKGLIINKLSYYNAEDTNRLLKGIYKEYEDKVSVIPECTCGATKGMWLKGELCNICGGEVTDPLELKHTIWAQAIENGPKFINPDFLNIINENCGGCIPYFLGVQPKKSHISKELKQAGEHIFNNVFGYEQTIKNIKNIVEYYISTRPDIKSNPKKIQLLEEILYIWDNQHSSLFNTYLPVSHSGNNMVKTSKGKFTDLEIANIINAGRSWVNFCSNPLKTKKNMDKAYAKFIYSLMLMGSYYKKEVLPKKKGIFRKELYSSRLPSTFRATIGLRHGKNRHDTLEVPWIVMHGAYRHQMLNILVNRYNYSYRDADEFLDWSVKNSNRLTNEIFDTMLSESFDKRGLPILWHRNPTLHQGSMLLMYIGSINRNPRMPVVGYSHLPAPYQNGDFDGDQLNGYCIQDRYVYERVKNFSVYMNTSSHTKYGYTSGLFNIGGPSTALLGEWIRDGK